MKRATDVVEDCRTAARGLRRSPMTKAIFDEAADEIERLGNVAAGRLRWAAMQSDRHDISFQLREWADEMDPNVQSKERSDG